MARKSKLLLALDAHKGRNFKLEQEKKLQKAAAKRKREKLERGGGGNEDEVEKQKAQDASDRDEYRERQQNETKDALNNGRGERIGDAGVHGEEAENQHQEDEDDEDIPLSELSADEATDVIPHQRLTINNSVAIQGSLKRISLISVHVPFSEHQSLVSSEPVHVPDPNDDMTRELAFYTVCVSATKAARSLLKAEGIPFSRPPDYFAEMVKSDEHMGKVKKKLYYEAAAKKASAEARKQRDLKKFGKQAQVAKLQQRQKDKRQMIEKINSLKRKRRSGDSGPTDDEVLFDVALEDTGKAGSCSEAGRRSAGSITKRQKKDNKFGFGGRKRFAKSGDAVSSGDMRGFSVTKIKGQKKGGKKRLGKSRRAAKGF